MHRLYRIVPHSGISQPIRNLALSVSRKLIQTERFNRNTAYARSPARATQDFG